jgi:hypothetical protein
MQKKFLENEYTYSDIVKNHTILGSKSLFPDYSEKRVNYINFMEDTSSTIDNRFTDSWNKRYVHQQALGIVLRGHEGRYPGNIIEIK